MVLTGPLSSENGVVSGSPVPRRTISGITRRDIFDCLSMDHIQWSGRLEESAFLERISDLANMPSTDSRFPDAAGDIWQHRINNPLDWSDDWIFSDGRFDLMHGPDEMFLRFLCEMVHPAVRADQEEARRLVRLFNEKLAGDDWALIATKQLSKRPVFEGRRRTLGKQPTTALRLPSTNGFAIPRCSRSRCRAAFSRRASRPLRPRRRSGCATRSSGWSPRTRTALSPRCRLSLLPERHVARGERLVDELDDRAAQSVAGEVEAAEPAQRGLGVGWVPVGRLRDPLDADVRPDPECDEQLAPPRGNGIGDLPGGDRSQLRGEVAEVVGVLEHFKDPARGARGNPRTVYRRSEQGARASSSSSSAAFDATTSTRRRAARVSRSNTSVRFVLAAASARLPFVLTSAIFAQAPEAPAFTFFCRQREDDGPSGPVLVRS